MDGPYAAIQTLTGRREVDVEEGPNPQARLLRSDVLLVVRFPEGLRCDIYLGFVD